MTKLIYGVGTNDADYNVWTPPCPYYKRWEGILKRCYSDKYKAEHQNYDDCFVSEDWLMFSNFKRWMENQDWFGNEIDKDLLVTGNKVYSKDTCLFVSKRVNNFIARSTQKLGKLPVGVALDRGNSAYTATIGFSGETKFLGMFKTTEQAHKAWLAEKIKYADILADEQTDHRVSDALRKRYREYKDPYFALGLDEDLLGLRLYCGVGDSRGTQGCGNSRASKAWRRIIKECYGAGSDGSLKVHTPWLYFKNFREWWESHGLPESYELDRTLLDKQNIGYYPDTCYLVPIIVYSAISDRLETEKVRCKAGIFIDNKLPNGVFKFDVDNIKHINSKFTHGYCARVYNGYNSKVYFNIDTPEEAREVYEIHKNKEMVKVAEAYKDIMREDIYENLKEFRGKP